MAPPAITGSRPVNTAAATQTQPAGATQPAPGPEKLAEMRLLKAGISGTETQQMTEFLQEGLQKAGLLPAGSFTPGEYDASTQKAVVEWQTRKNLKVDGVVGQQTWGSFFGISVEPGIDMLKGQGVREGWTAAGAPQAQPQAQTQAPQTQGTDPAQGTAPSEGVGQTNQTNPADPTQSTPDAAAAAAAEEPKFTNTFADGSPVLGLDGKPLEATKEQWTDGRVSLLPNSGKAIILNPGEQLLPDGKGGVLTQPDGRIVVVNAQQQPVRLLNPDGSSPPADTDMAAQAADAKALSGVDPNAAAVDPNAAVVDPNAAVVDPNAAAVDPNAAAVDPNAAAVDPNAAAVDPNAPSNAQVGPSGKVVDTAVGAAAQVFVAKKFKNMAVGKAVRKELEATFDAAAKNQGKVAAKAAGAVSKADAAARLAAKTGGKTAVDDAINARLAAEAARAEARTATKEAQDAAKALEAKPGLIARGYGAVKGAVLGTFSVVAKPLVAIGKRVGINQALSKHSAPVIKAAGQIASAIAASKTGRVVGSVIGGAGKMLKSFGGRVTAAIPWVGVVASGYFAKNDLEHATEVWKDPNAPAGKRALATLSAAASAFSTYGQAAQVWPVLGNIVSSGNALLMAGISAGSSTLEAIVYP